MNYSKMLWTFQRIEKEVTLRWLICKVSITLLPNPDKEKGKIFSPISNEYRIKIRQSIRKLNATVLKK